MQRSWLKRSATIGLVILAAETRAFAQEPTTETTETTETTVSTTQPEPTVPTPPAPTIARTTKTPRVRLRHNLLVDGIVTGAMAAAVLTWGLVLKPTGEFGSDECTICDGPGTDVNALDAFFRDNLRHDDIGPAATTSHVLSYGVSPAAGVALTVGVAAHDGRIDEAPLNALLVVEASLAAVLVKEAASLAIRRERPEVHAQTGEEKQKSLSSGDPLESFPSGHLASELAIMTSVGVISSMRGYRLTPLVWAVGGALAATIGYLRIAADQHYFTDNLVGGAIGIGVGAAVPLLFHRPQSSASSTAATWLGRGMVMSNGVPGGRTVSVGWTF